LHTLEGAAVCANFCAERIQVAREAPSLKPRAALNVESVDCPVFASRAGQGQQRVSRLCYPPVEHALITEAAPFAETANFAKLALITEAARFAETANPVKFAPLTEARKAAETAMASETAIRAEGAPLAEAAITIEASIRIKTASLAERTSLAESTLAGETTPLAKTASRPENTPFAESTTCAENARRAETAPLAENASFGEYAPITESTHCRVVTSWALPKPVNYRHRIEFFLCKRSHLVFPHLGSAPSSSRPPCFRAVSHARSQRRRMAGSAHSRRAMRRRSTRA
jgi:hypothetical protein